MFRGRAGLRRDDEKCASRLDGIRHGHDGGGYGRVEQDRLRKPLSDSESAPDGLGSQGASAHPQQGNLPEPGFTHLRGNASMPDTSRGMSSGSASHPSRSAIPSGPDFQTVRSPPRMRPTRFSVVQGRQDRLNLHSWPSLATGRQVVKVAPLQVAASEECE